MSDARDQSLKAQGQRIAELRKATFLDQLDRIEQRLVDLDDQIRQLRFDVIGREMEELQRASEAAAPTPASRRRRRSAASA